MDFGVATCRGLSRRGACVLQARFAPLDPYPLDRLPSLSIYISNNHEVDRYKARDLSRVGTPRALKRFIPRFW